jgi:hypothetical protein
MPLRVTNIEPAPRPVFMITEEEDAQLQHKTKTNQYIECFRDDESGE